MRTLVISDLHLGKAERTDLLRRPALREPLLEALADVDRLVILGDGLELREAAHRDAVDVAGAFFAAVGEVLGPDKPLILLAGNHDHGIAAGWIDARLQTEPSGFLGLEQRFAPADAGPLARRLAEAALPARVELAYPGVWLRDDVYAFHGHYADVHATVPTFERLAAGVMARYVARLPPEHATPDDYEAVLSPLFAWLHALTQRAEHTRGQRRLGRLRQHLREAHRLRPPQAAAAGAGARPRLPRRGRGPQPRRARPARGQPLTECAAPRLPARDQRDDPAAGHPAPPTSSGATRTAPVRGPSDDLAEWTAPTGARIINTGSWVYQPHFIGPTPNGSPYWPGTAVIVDSEGPPRLVRLLGERGHEVLRPGPA